MPSIPLPDRALFPDIYQAKWDIADPEPVSRWKLPLPLSQLGVLLK